MAKFRRVCTTQTIQNATIWEAKGAATFSFFNMGNVNVTIDGQLVLQPLQGWEGPTENPEVEDYSRFKIEFDETNTPALNTPVGGTTPPEWGQVSPGDPQPKRDKRLLVFITHVTPTGN